MLWFGSRALKRDRSRMNRDPGLALSRNSVGSRAANADGAPRKHGAFHSSQPPDRKAPPASVDRPELRKSPGGGGQGGAGLGAIVVHLAHQRGDAVELQFLADESDKGDVQRGAIEIALEVEQKDL